MNPRLLAYLERIGLSTRPAADAAGLEAVLFAHRQAIAFENLDVRLGRPIKIDSDSAFAKLVSGRRGGYCFEQNRLLADMLDLLGIPSRPLLARVRMGAPPDAHPPRTHVLLLADIDGGPWIADAGFGGSYVPAMPLVDGAEARTGDGVNYRLRRIGQRGSLGGEWVFERADKDQDWQVQYTFDLTEVAPDDLALSNHWTATAATSRFMNLHIVTRVLPDGFASMTDRVLKVTSGGDTATQDVADRHAYGTILGEVFGIVLSRDELEKLPLF